MAKRKPMDMGQYTASTLEQKAYSWCINNGIYITPKFRTEISWYIEIVIGSKNNVSPNYYAKVEIWKQVFKFYVYYYERYSGKAKVETEHIIPKKGEKKRAQDEVKQKQIKSNDNELF